ncbi:phage tail sheath family protein [Massilia sp. CCM 8695]|uniref:Phage tail sheath family protein n=1 Tax=Massilia frigida TaxID=2609281 RepID=A0ABX0N6S3_9BURK|nr:phage tail sheath C-terminal domain-containing protein [Massilia frigida]NHZ80787.1 phage tail sheath family protein [Massilia frigida]
MVQVSYPGVYIVEKSSGVRTITGVATSVAAFVGFTRKGPVDKAVAITSFADFERSHGGLDRDSPVSYAVRQFFLNGGTQALIVRVASGHGTAGWVLLDGTTPVPLPVLDVSAASPGAWGNALRVSVELTEVRNPASDFNLVISQVPALGGDPVVIETHRNLSLDTKSAQYVESVVNHASAAVRVTRHSPLTFTQAGFAVSGPLAGAPLNVPANTIISGIVNGTTPFVLNVLAPPLPATAWPSIAAFVTAVTNAIGAGGYGAALAASESDVNGAAGAGHLKLTSALPVDESSSVVISGGPFGSLAANIKMGLANGGIERSGAAQHRPVALDKAVPSTKGADGAPGGEALLIGNELAKTGIHALLDVDMFNLLVIPETFDMTAPPAGSALIAAATDLCEKRRAFYIVDAPSNRKLSDIVTWAGVSHSRNAASYFPPVRIIDPLDGMRPRAMAPSGTLAGVYARTDATRGVWKAPAGTDAVLNGVLELALPLSDLENAQINPKGINALRSFPAYGRVAWGARTMKGDDSQADEYKYVPIRRLALFLEESLYRGTQWVVFEPNDEPLWAQIRLNLGVFMNGLFRQGAFQGKTPQEAYFVKCDKETTTQADRNLGIVNVLVGFAPLKPAEFVVLTIQQIAGDLQ